MWVRVLRLETREKMELTPLCGVEGGFTPKSVLKLGVLFAKHHNILLRLSAFIIRGVRYQFDTSPPPLLSPDYDGNYTPSNRRDWWVTLDLLLFIQSESSRSPESPHWHLEGPKGGPY